MLGLDLGDLVLVFPLVVSLPEALLYPDPAGVQHLHIGLRLLERAPGLLLQRQPAAVLLMVLFELLDNLRELRPHDRVHLLFYCLLTRHHFSPFLYTTLAIVISDTSAVAAYKAPRPLRPDPDTLTLSS